ncbi:MAG TPA: hypothetical protein VFE62_11345 [Gemmataceae bacterium]|nr:hypothetical protein [Gemmataceae bacterium]
MPTARWHGSRLEVRARAVPRYLWSTVSIDVLIDGAPVLRTGGQFRARGGVTSEFRHDGERHTAELSWGTVGGRGFPFMLRIDGEIVLATEVPVDNMTAVLVGWGTVLVAVIACTVFAFQYFVR